MKKITALYERISKKGSAAQGRDLSIPRQREILEQFAKKNGFVPFRHYEDVGVSGKNFRRPGFQKILSEIEEDKISAIIVVDVSRFGRNYLESGYYMEEYFPKHGVRFLSVQDGVDTYMEWENEFLPFLNIIHDWLSRETSRKLRQRKALVMQAGKRTNYLPPYGYLQIPGAPEQWVIDPYAGEIVKKIYSLFLHGSTRAEIARYLMESSIPTPKNLRQQSEDGVAPQRSPWRPCTIDAILRQEEYTGITITNKYWTDPETGRQVLLPKEQWIRTSNFHEPLISTKDFRQAQRILDSSVHHSHEVPAFIDGWRGLLFAADTEIPLTPQYSGKDLRWRTKGGRPEANVSIMAEHVDDELFFVLDLLWESMFPFWDMTSLILRLEQEILPLEDQLQALEQIRQSRWNHHNHQIKRQYEQLLRQHHLSHLRDQSPVDAAPLAKVEQQMRQLEKKMDHIRFLCERFQYMGKPTLEQWRALTVCYLRRVSIYNSYYSSDRLRERQMDVYLNFTPDRYLRKIPENLKVARDPSGIDCFIYESYPARHFIHLHSSDTNSQNLLEFTISLIREGSFPLFKEIEQ